MATFTTTEKKNVYEMITELIISKLEAGVNPWSKSWSNSANRTNEQNGPKNFITGKVYNGINYLILSCTPYDCPYFLTFKQIQDKKGSLKAGSKGLPVVYYSKFVKKVKNESTGVTEEKNSFFLKYSTVFNLEQTNIAIPVAPVAEVPVVVETPSLYCDRLGSVYTNYPNKPKTISSDKSRCYYSPSFDVVNMPDIEQFDKVENYYSTFYHELVHSTGHYSRLDREFGGTFGNDKYAKEELIAELGATFLCTHMNILNTTVDNSASYLKGWASKLKGENSKFIFEASKAAKLAVEHILGGKSIEVVEEEE